MMTLTAESNANSHVARRLLILNCETNTENNNVHYSVSCNKGVKLKLAYHVVENIGKCPGHCDRQEWQTQEHVVNESDNQYVCDPHAFTVKVCGVGVGVTVCNSDIHCQRLHCYNMITTYHY